MTSAIRGHSELDEQTIGQINDLKTYFEDGVERIENLMEQVQLTQGPGDTIEDRARDDAAFHWLEMARTHVQTASMFTVRALAAPESRV